MSKLILKAFSTTKKRGELMNYVRSLLIMSMVLIVCSCSTTYRVTKIPRTEENVKAARGCQHTVAVATGYDQNGYNKLKINCYKTLDNTTFEVLPEDPGEIAGCQQFDDITIGGGSGIFYLYYLCKP